jgi:tripartite-type tricarboxylate transporter receptor subunit TctC
MTTIAGSLRAALVVLALLLPWGAAADDFYQGKTVTMLVGFSPGGGFDTNARLLARYLGRHIPGNPTVVVVNMPGGGSTVAIVRLDTDQPKDGTVIDTFNFGLLADSLLQPDRFKADFRKYTWIGSISEDLTVCYSFGPSAPKTIEAMTKRDHFYVGSAGVGTSDDLNTKILKNIFGVPIKQVAGYPGSADIRVAIERGELDGDCGAWSSLPDEWVTGGKVNPVSRSTLSSPEDMPKGVPYTLEIAPNDRAKRIIRFLLADGQLGRPFIVSHSVPADRVKILRDAFNATVADKDFLADAAKLRLPVSPTNGEDALKTVTEIYDTPADIIAAAKKVLEE